MTRRPKRSDVVRLGVLEVVEFRSTSWAFASLTAGEILALIYRVPLKVAYAALERDYDAGFLECGVSINYPWLTDKGRAELEKARGS